MSVEVFKTNISHYADAESILRQISDQREDYVANFDLEDCDKILRVECQDEEVESVEIIELVKNSGFKAEILSGDIDSDYRVLHKIVCT